MLWSIYEKFVVYSQTYFGNHFSWKNECSFCHQRNLVKKFSNYILYDSPDSPDSQYFRLSVWCCFLKYFIFSKMLGNHGNHLCLTIIMVYKVECFKKLGSCNVHSLIISYQKNHQKSWRIMENHPKNTSNVVGESWRIITSWMTLCLWGILT